MRCAQARKFQHPNEDTDTTAAAAATEAETTITTATMASKERRSQRRHEPWCSEGRQVGEMAETRREAAKKKTGQEKSIKRRNFLPPFCLCLAQLAISRVG